LSFLAGRPGRDWTAGAFFRHARVRLPTRVPAGGKSAECFRESWQSPERRGIISPAGIKRSTCLAETPMTRIQDRPAVESAVRKAAAETPVADMHTHLFPPSHGRLLLWGIDELLTYHYLTAELLSAEPRIKPREFFAMPKPRQAETVWEQLFVRRSPVSESAGGVITALNALGLDGRQEDLNSIRTFFASWKVEDHLSNVFRLAGVDYAVMTNDPFNPAEAEHWLAGRAATERLRPALRIDPLVLNWPAAAEAMRAQGYKTSARQSSGAFAEARRFLADWAKRIHPVYLAVSLPPEFDYPGESRVLDEAVLPAARELRLPVAMMMGVRRGVNPELGLAGDGVGGADLEALGRLCAAASDVKFLATVLARRDQHELCVAARLFPNLHVFGCWWYCNTPSVAEEVTRLRIELLGTDFTCQHSDARVLEQLIYKWSHMRKVAADVLVEKHLALFDAGWRPEEREIRRDARAIFGGAFESFVGA